MPIDPQVIDDVKASLKNDGYFQIDRLLDKSCTKLLASGVERIFEAGWPTPFSVVYDEYWELFHSLRLLISGIMGAEYKQVPNFWCWYVDTNNESKGWGHHRDRPSVNSILDDGLPATLTTWIPLTDASPANGCIYIVPSRRDPNYPNNLDSRNIDEYQNIRALPANEGDVLGWTETLLHWGSRSSSKAANPRVSISFTFQRGDQNPYEVPLFEPSRYPSFNERLGLIAQNVCKYQGHSKTTPEILFACQRLSGLIPTISVQDGVERQTLEVDKRLSDSMLWQMQEQYFEKERLNAWKGERFYSTNRMPFVECFVELVTASLLDCAAILDSDSPLYILELGGGSGCFAYRFLNEFAESREDFELLKKLNLKYILTDFSESLVQEWLKNKKLDALKECGILDFATFRPQLDKSLKLLVSGQVLLQEDFKNPLIVIANHVFDSIKQDAFRSINGVLQEAKFTLFREASNCSLNESPQIEDLKTSERFTDVVGARYNDATLDSILEHYRTNLDQASIVFPIGALSSIGNLSNLCQGKLIVLSADQGFTRLDSEQIVGLGSQEFAKHGSFSFDLNFDAYARYFEASGGTSIVEAGDHSSLRIAFSSLLKNSFQRSQHFFRQQLQKKDIVDSQAQLEDMIRKWLQAGDNKTSRVALFLSIVRASNFEPALFATAHRFLLDEQIDDLNELDKPLEKDLLDAISRTARNVYIVDNDYQVLDSILRLYIDLDRFTDCFKLSEEIIETYGDVGTALDHAALSSEALGNYILAHDYFRRSFENAKNHDWARAGMIRMRPHLPQSGDSIMKFTTARPI